MQILREVYENELHPDYSGYHAGITTSLGKGMIPFFKSPPQTNGLLLDIGCADGVFLQKVKEIGFESWGIDFDSKSISVAQKKRELKNVYSMSLEEFAEFAKVKDTKFNVVTFFEVLEHQDDIQRFIRLVRDLLADHGIVAGSVPNRNRFLAEFSNKAFGEGDSPPHHFTRWSMPVLRRFLEENGFEVTELSTCNFYSVGETSYWWFRVFFRNFVNLFRVRVKRKLTNTSESASQPIETFPRPRTFYGRFLYSFLISANELVQWLEKYLCLPIAIATVEIVNREGQQIYFTARKAL